MLFILGLNKLWVKNFVTVYASIVYVTTLVCACSLCSFDDGANGSFRNPRLKIG